MSKPGVGQVRALVGARVSHVQGAEKISHIEQTKTGSDYADRHEWPIVGTFEDLDVSAMKTTPFERPDLGPWLDDERQGRDWDALIVSKTDRLFRSARDCVLLTAWLEQRHKILVLVDDGLVLDFYHDQSDLDPFQAALARIFLLLAAMFAEIEGRRFIMRAQGRERTLRHTDRWAHGNPTFGFLIVSHPTGEGKALGPDDPARVILHTVAAWIVDDGWSLNRSIQQWAAQWPSPKDWTRIRNGQEPQGELLTSSKLKGILTSPATQGLKMANGRVVLDSEGEPIRVGPAVFTPERWDEIQRAIAEREAAPRGRTWGPNKLLGVAICGSCGKNLRLHSTVRKSNAHPEGLSHQYYRCQTPPKPCGVSIMASWAEELVEEEFLRQCGELHVVRRVYDPGDDVSYDLEGIEKTISALREDRALGLFDGPDEAIYRDQMRALLSRRTELSAHPVRRAGWVFETTEWTYAEAWSQQDDEGRLKLLNDAGVKLKVLGKSEFELQIPENIKERMMAGAR
jgi:site-specific DNA recombinase